MFGAVFCKVNDIQCLYIFLSSGFKFRYFQNYNRLNHHNEVRQEQYNPDIHTALWPQTAFEFAQLIGGSRGGGGVYGVCNPPFKFQNKREK